MSFSVAVAGASGYAGGETLRLLAAHPEAQIGAITANASAGQSLGRHHPHLASLGARVLEETATDVLAGHDVIVLALPHGKSGELATALEVASPDSILVDLGADHRLESAQDWADYYGGEHPGAWTYGMPELLLGWPAGLSGTADPNSGAISAIGGTSRPGGALPAEDLSAEAPTEPPEPPGPPGLPGLPETPETPGAGDQTALIALKQRTALQGARRIAVPGCNVTAVTLALAPGIASGQLSPVDLTAVLANGVSGAGKGLKPHLTAAEILGAASPYGVGGSHRHIPEIIQNLAKAAGAPRSSPGAAGAVPGARPDQTTAPGSTSGSAAAPAPSPSRSAGPRPTISFTPTLVPMSRGILATVTAKPGPRFDPAQLRRPWELAYGDERFVHLLAPGQWPSTAQTLGANTALIQVAHDTRADRVVLVCVIDNLVKGTAGQAIQSINLALGLPEATGLELNGVAP